MAKPAPMASWIIFDDYRPRRSRHKILMSTFSHFMIMESIES